MDEGEGIFFVLFTTHSLSIKSFLHKIQGERKKEKPDKKF